jgi:hypothetical protein
MAVLERSGTRLRAPLLSRHLVGRSNLARLRLSEPSVSAEHAMISWDGHAWQVQDLGSKNGTALDGRRLASGERVVLQRGAVLTFGSAGNRWALTDDSPPRAMALPLDGGEPVSGEHDLVALPDAEAPEVSVYRDAGGDWVLDRDGALERIVDGREVEAGGRRFTLHLPDVVAPTWEAGEAKLSLERLALRFRVSRDQEYIELAVSAEGRTVDLGARAHHALLLELARLRLKEQQEAPGEETAHGWIYQEELAQRLALDEPHLNVAIYRCRQHLAAAGVLGAAGIVERRKPTRQLRIGVGRIELASV